MRRSSKTSYETKRLMTKRPWGPTSNVQTFYGTKHHTKTSPTGQNVLRLQVLQDRPAGQNVLRVNHPRGQNVQRDKVSYGTKPITGQNVLVTKLPP